MNKIKSITIVNGQGTKSYHVGDNGVTQISSTVEYYDNAVDREYFVYKHEKLLAQIINCPVEIHWESDV